MYESIISENNFDNFINFTDYIEYFPDNSNNIEDFYKPEVFYGKKSFINFSIKNFSETSHQNCKINDLLNKKCIYLKQNIEIINEIRNNIISGNIELLLNNIIETGEDIILEIENNIYQITSSTNQKNKEYNNISSINLGKCESLLKSENHINEEEPLLIFKIDNYMEGNKMPIINYEVYNSKTKQKLNLNICKEEKINIFIPVSINEKEIYKYNPNSDYYIDLCFTYTTENKTDITLKDRNIEFLENNMSLCENNCEFNEYNHDTKKVDCKCFIKIDLFVSELVIDINILKKNINITNTINLKVMKCYYKLFSLEGITNNIGFYIILFIILLYIICSINFCVKGYKILYSKIKEIDINKNEIKKSKYSKSFNANKNKLKLIHKTKNFQKNNKNKKLKHKENKEKKNENIYNNSNSSINFKSIKNLYHVKDNNNLKGISKHEIFYKNKKYLNIVNNNDLNFNDFELNTISYQEALLNDKRTYFEYFWSLLKTNHPIFFTFILSNDYNSKIIKICLFQFSFILYYTTNALFFTENKIHHIFIKNGVYNLIYEFPSIIYSSIITLTINFIVSYFSLTQKSVLKLKHLKEKEYINSEMKHLFINIKIKFISFFIISYIFLFLFWYYISCFCAIYKNTQFYLIKNSICSFGFSLFYKIGIYLLPGVFRIPSLKNNKRHCLYSISLILQYL